VHFSSLFAAYFNSLAATMSGARVLCHIRSSHPQVSLRDRLAFLPLRNYLFVSEATKRTFALSMRRMRANVIYDAIEISSVDFSEVAAVRAEFCIPDESTIIGMVARVAPEKDFDTLALAAAQVLAKHPTTRFLIVGDHSSTERLGIYFEEVLHKLTSLGIRDSFIFAGYRKDVARLLSAVDISVLCTHREGFPLSILESMAAGKPVIATAVGGVPEIVKHGETGYLHQHLDSGGLANAIISLIESPAVSERLATAGRDIVRRDYSRQKYAETMARLYFDLLGREPETGSAIDAATVA